MIEPALCGACSMVLRVLVSRGLHIEVLASVCGAASDHTLVLSHSSSLILLQVLASLGTSPNWNVLGMVPVDASLLLTEAESLWLVIAATLRQGSLMVVSV